MMEIPLTQGKITLIDDEDWPLMSQHTWCAHQNTPGHWVAESGGSLLLHRLIAGAKKGEMVDHWDGNSLNNQRSNLRVCTNSQNQQNSRSRGGSSRFKGVSWYTRHQKWRVAFNWNGKTIFIGYFDDEIEAAKAYNAAILPRAGQFAYLNNFSDN